MPPQKELLAAEALQALAGNPSKPIPLGIPERSPQITPSPSHSSSDTPQPRPQRSMFGNMILTATSMLLPRETQQRLRTFVRMLRLANDSLSRKVIDLKEAMDQESQGVEPELSANALRQDMIATIKKSTNLIASVAGNSLPQSARFAVRKMVLSLPSQWRAHQWQAQQESTESAAQSAVLSLASETLHLIRDVIAVVDDTLDRAETWCGSIGAPPSASSSAGAPYSYAHARRLSTESSPDMDSLALHSVNSSDSLSSQSLPHTPVVEGS